MRVSISLRLVNEDWAAASAYVVEAERLGVDCVWSAEVTPLAFMAARTSRIRLGTGIMQAGTRTPALVAMTYNDAYRRAGYADAAIEVPRLWLEGRRDEAAARVPDEIALRSNLLGTDEMVRGRIRAYRDAGITTLRVEPEGATLDERLQTLGRAVALVKAVNAEPAGRAPRRLPPMPPS